MGEVAIVTGGGNGIGRSVCLRFAQAGISIAIVDCDVKGAEGVRDEVKRTGGDAEAYGVDDYVSKPFGTDVLIQVIKDVLARKEKKGPEEE